MKTKSDSEMKLRDLLAAPFCLIASFMDYLAVRIGGKWTAEMYKEQAIKIGKLYENSTKS